MIIFVLLIVVANILAVHFPPGIKLCHRSDPNFAQCLAKNMGDAFRVLKDGNKDFGIPKINPLFLEKIEIKAEPGRAVSLQQKYTNVYVHGIIDVDLTSYFKIELDTKCQVVLDAKLPRIILEADFEYDGKLLVFPIKSNGKCNITQYNCVNRHTIKCEKYTKNNEVYLRVTNYTMDINPEKIRYDFDNIFLGNKEIADVLIKTVNENEKLVFNEVKGGFEEIFSILYMQIMNNVFSKVPMNKIFLD